MTESAQEHSVVAIYDTHTAAEAAIKALQQSGFDMKTLSIVGKDFQSEERAIGFYTAGDRIKVWGGRGAIWGTLWGMLFGGAVFLIPTIGPLVVMGPLVAWIVGALEGAAVGGATGALAAALSGIGIASDSVIKYEVDVKAGKFLVLAHGGADAVASARVVLGTTDASRLATHYRTLDHVMSLLSDDEIASVSTAETAIRLPDDEEYVDLAQLEQGVRRSPGPATPLGRVLPRKAVQDATWRKIVAQLPPSPPLSQ